MEGVKSDYYMDFRKNIFGSEIQEIILDNKLIHFVGPMFVMPKTQKNFCKEIGLQTDKIFGVELIKKTVKTNNWFENLLNKKEEFVRIYY